MRDTELREPSTWRIVTAAILDFFTAFFVIGYIVAALTGGFTGSGFSLHGWAAILFFVLLVGYFVVANKMFGGTLWKYILKARRPKAGY